MSGDEICKDLKSWLPTRRIANGIAGRRISWEIIKASLTIIYFKLAFKLKAQYRTVWNKIAAESNDIVIRLTLAGDSANDPPHLYNH